MSITGILSGCYAESALVGLGWGDRMNQAYPFES